MKLLQTFRLLLLIGSFSAAGEVAAVAAESAPQPSGDPAATASDGGLVRAAIPLRAIPPQVAEIADGFMLAYRMPAIRGGHTTATAMLFTPKVKAPAGGWPLVVFGHDTTGWARECAPSIRVQASGHWEHTPWIADLLKSGIVVAAVDYEGMGDAALGVPDTGHPYYNLLSTGRAMAYGAIAAKRALGDKLSGAWGVTGLSEGGFAALAGAQFSGLAREAEVSLDYRGAISLAPVPYIGEIQGLIGDSIRRKSAAYDLEGGFRELQFYNTETVYLVRSWLTAGYSVDPKSIYGDRMLKIYSEKSRLCLGELWGTVAQDIGAWANDSKLLSVAYDYPGVRHDAAASPVVQAIYRENEAGQVKLPGQTLLVQGTADPYSLTPLLLKLNHKMLLEGSDVGLALIEGADHFGVVMPALPIMRAYWQRLFGAATSPGK